MKASFKKGPRYLLTVFILCFLLAAGVGWGTELLISRTSIRTALTFLMLIILIHIAFDTVGIAVTAATESSHHARAANKIKGAKESVWLIRHADMVSNFTNDIVGDITSTISGAMGAAIILDLIALYPSLKPPGDYLNDHCLGADCIPDSNRESYWKIPGDS